MKGTDLFEALVQNTGLPENYVRARLERLVMANGGTLDEVTLEDVRELLSDLLLDLIQESQQEPA